VVLAEVAAVNAAILTLQLNHKLKPKHRAHVANHAKKLRLPTRQQKRLMQ